MAAGRLTILRDARHRCAPAGSSGWPEWGAGPLATSGEAPCAYETILYDVDGAVATITLNRPEQLNTIIPPMPDEIEAAVRARCETRP